MVDRIMKEARSQKRKALHAGETKHLNADNFKALSRFERANCEAEGVSPHPFSRRVREAMALARANDSAATSP